MSHVTHMNKSCHAARPFVFAASININPQSFWEKDLEIFRFCWYLRTLWCHDSIVCDLDFVLLTISLSYFQVFGTNELFV